MECPATALQIRARAEAIRSPREYVGWFEWLLWGEMASANVMMLLGDNVVDVQELFGPDLPSGRHPRSHFVAGVWQAGGQAFAVLPGERLVGINHFVIGRPLVGDVPPSPATEVSSDGGRPLADVVARRAGWELLPTASWGQCGLDCMSFWGHYARTEATWNAIRNDLADLALACAHEPSWQAAFRACDELEAPPAVARPLVSTDLAATSEALPPPPGVAPDMALASVPPLVSASPRFRAVLPATPLKRSSSAVSSASPSSGFDPWLKGFSEEALQERTATRESLREAEREWRALRRAEVPPTPPSEIKGGLRRQRRQVPLGERRDLGRKFMVWRSNQGAGSKKTLEGPQCQGALSLGGWARAPWAEGLVRGAGWAPRCPGGWPGAFDPPPRTMGDSEDFLASEAGLGRGGVVSKADRQLLRRAILTAKRGDTVVPHAGHGRQPTYALGRRPKRFLTREVIRQGAPYKASVIGERLWDWFVDIRRSFATTVSPKFVLSKARQLADVLLEEQKRLGVYTPLPVLDRHFLLRWKRNRGVVFRRPNMRYKCSKPVLLSRLKAMWRNVIVVRRLGEIFLKKDLSDCFWGIDEKPIHFNESGSKGQRTLEVQGVESVRLRENHAATRERVSLMTSVTSDAASARDAANMPLELLFKARSSRRTANLKAPSGVKVSFAWSDKGSYRQEHLLAYLAKWLPEWTAERASAEDYRVLMMDVAASHCGDEVRRFAWSRGFVVLFHFGCTTGVTQVNDTDLHGAFEAVYIEVEQRSFNTQQALAPGCITRTPQDVVDDAVSAWRLCNHEQGVRGHKRNGLTNALDGSEDMLLSREARVCWYEAGMPAVRRQVLREIEDAVAAGTLRSFEEWEKWVKPPEDPGVVQGDGAEFEGELLPGEPPWVVEADLALVQADEKEVEGMDGSPAALVALVAKPGDPAASVEAAKAAAGRLAQLKRLREQAVKASEPAIVSIADRSINQLERGLRAKTPEEERANELLRAALAERFDREAAATARQRELALRRINLLKEARAKSVLEKARSREEKERWARVKKKLAALPKAWLPADVGPGEKGKEGRRELLERFKCLSPDLPLPLEVRWTKIRDAFAAYWPKACPDKDLGRAFLHRIEKVKARLGVHYKGPKAASVAGGNPGAFEAFVLQMEKETPRPSGVLDM